MNIDNCKIPDSQFRETRIKLLKEKRVRNVMRAGPMSAFYLNVQ